MTQWNIWRVPPVYCGQDEKRATYIKVYISIIYVMIEHTVLIIVNSYGYNEDSVGVFVADVQTIESRHIQACELDARTTESRQIEAGGANMCISK